MQPELVEAQEIDPMTDSLAIPGLPVRMKLKFVRTEFDGTITIRTTEGVELTNLQPTRKLWVAKGRPR